MKKVQTNSGTIPGLSGATRYLAMRGHNGPEMNLVLVICPINR